MLKLTPAKRTEYRAGIARRKAESLQKHTAHLARAWEVAKVAAKVLREKYGATRVVVFGSLVHPARFHVRSDVDLAAWGIDERAYLRAVADVTALNADVLVDLVRVEEAAPSLLASIEQEGQEL
ncbi:MAG: nucleotidyltransferase [Chloroflexota bacterium]|nr:nucleotidyltransferase domain-containing protein [Caldilinea sp.]GIK73088.1 MAG: nucleotidyltransferase [Chloroflexota bacterium]